MREMLEFMAAPFAACVVLVGIHAYLGLHVLLRGVIFVDLALAQIAALGRFAWDAGLAFQIVDDILGITADESKLGKPVGSDIREGKKTLIMIHALANADEEQMKVLKNAVGVEGASKDEIDAVVKTLSEIGSIQYAKDEAEKYTASAFESIKAIPDGPSKQDLIDLVNYFVQREY